MAGAAPSEGAASHGKDSRLGGNVFDFGVTKAADDGDVHANNYDGFHCLLQSVLVA